MGMRRWGQVLALAAAGISTVKVLGASYTWGGRSGNLSDPRGWAEGSAPTGGATDEWYFPGPVAAPCYYGVTADGPWSVQTVRVALPSVDRGNIEIPPGLSLKERMERIISICTPSQVRIQSGQNGALHFTGSSPSIQVDLVNPIGDLFELSREENPQFIVDVPIYFDSDFTINCDSYGIATPDPAPVNPGILVPSPGLVLSVLRQANIIITKPLTATQPQAKWIISGNTNVCYSSDVEPNIAGEWWFGAILHRPG